MEWINILNQEPEVGQYVVVKYNKTMGTTQETYSMHHGNASMGLTEEWPAKDWISFHTYAGSYMDGDNKKYRFSFALSATLDIHFVDGVTIEWQDAALFNPAEHYLQRISRQLGSTEKI